jgi:hypothetical protein
LPSSNPTRTQPSDQPDFCSKSRAALLLRTAKAVTIGDRVIQLLAPTNLLPVSVKITAEMQRQARYDIAVNTPPIGLSVHPNEIDVSTRQHADESGNGHA